MSKPRALRAPSKRAWRVLQNASDALGAIGAWVFALWYRASGMSSLGVAVIWQASRPLTWRRTVQAEFWRHGAQVMLQGLPPIVVTGLLVGIGMVFQVLYWLQLVGQESVIGEFLVLVLVREIAPVLVALIVIGRSGAVMINELGVMRVGGQAHLLNAQGLDLLHFLVVPRVVAAALGVFCLCIVFLVVALAAGLVAANTLGLANTTLFDFLEEVLTAMGPGEYALVPLKTLAMGFAIGVISCDTGLEVEGDVMQVAALLPRGFVTSVLATLLISGVLTILL
jgi:phospholipid/cholesterol/gamma-HCH transport system permease protein